MSECTVATFKCFKNTVQHFVDLVSRTDSRNVLWGAGLPNPDKMFWCRRSQNRNPSWADGCRIHDLQNCMSVSRSHLVPLESLDVWLPVECRNVATGLACKSTFPGLANDTNPGRTEAGHLGGCCRRRRPARQQNRQFRLPLPSIFCPLAADTLSHPTMLSVMRVPHIGIHLSHAIAIDERYHCVNK